ncbi:MAG: translation initiation factor eIF-1A [Candidatus Aenigmarchaeota archaeon]|nr:translation initiation factor eIF-1A [Candidatus Aenigmarchaeota archaeon]
MDTRTEPGAEEFIRVRLPRGKEILGEIEIMQGASRFMVICKDGKKRLCRIPGKFRKRITIRVGDIVLIEPWEIEGDEKGDVIWIYTRTQANWLRKKGYV